VAARNGAVTLTGYIGTYGGKLAAERCAKRLVRGCAPSPTTSRFG
jgi:osmotically-inducible protein OsmY